MKFVVALFLPLMAAPFSQANISELSDLSSPPQILVETRSPEAIIDYNSSTGKSKHKACAVVTKSAADPQTQENITDVSLRLEFQRQSRNLGLTTDYDSQYLYSVDSGGQLFLKEAYGKRIYPNQDDSNFKLTANKLYYKRGTLCGDSNYALSINFNNGDLSDIAAVETSSGMSKACRTGLTLSVVGIFAAGSVSGQSTACHFNKIIEDAEVLDNSNSHY